MEGDDFLRFWAAKKHDSIEGKSHFPSQPQTKPTPSTARRPLPHSHPHLSPRSVCPLACSLLHSVLYLPLPLARLTPNSTIFNTLNSAMKGSQAERAALAAATVHLLSLSPPRACRQLKYQMCTAGESFICFLLSGSGSASRPLLSFAGHREEQRRLSEAEVHSSGGWRALCWLGVRWCA